MSKPKVLIFSGYGFNSEEETKFGFEWAGAEVDIVHINDIIDGKAKLKDYQILAFPGGFSYGDDTGSGNAYANKLKNYLWDDVHSFIEKDKLAIGICNGFQVIVNLGLVPALNNDYGERQASLLHNSSARLVTRWVDLKVESSSPWLSRMETFSIPIAHGEGNFYAPKEVLATLNKKKMVALRYIEGETCTFLDLPANPNGAVEDIAGITDESGKVFGLMPHPERGMFFVQLPHWTYLKEKLLREGKEIPKEGPGLQIFKNGVSYFS